MLPPQTPLQFTSSRGVSFSSFPPSSPGFFISKLPFLEVGGEREGGRGEGWRVEEVGLGGMEYVEWPERGRRCIVSPGALSSSLLLFFCFCFFVYILIFILILILYFILIFSLFSIAPSFTAHIDSPSSLSLSQNTLHLSVRFTSCYSPSTPSYSSFSSLTTISPTSSLQLENNNNWRVLSEESILLVGGEEEGGGFVRWKEGGVEVFVRGWGGEDLERYFCDCEGFGFDYCYCCCYYYYCYYYYHYYYHYYHYYHY